MSDTPEEVLVRAQVPTVNGRPIRKDEIELHARGVYIESWLPERRSRRKPLLFVHGELAGSWAWERFLGYFAARGWEGHALNLRNHYWSQTADPEELSFESYVEDVGAAMDRFGPSVVVVGHGMGALLALKAAERRAVAGLVLIAPEGPLDVRGRTEAHEIRDVPDVYGRSQIGWATLPERLRRDHPDLTLADVLRVQHLLGQKPRESGRARRAMLRGVRVDPDAFRTTPRLVIAGGLDRTVRPAEAEQLAGWLGADYQPFGAHSHFGLILGEESHQQVADAVRGFLEANRL
ncbi:MAG TPA: alpha/beta fold hydrolase [Candidatus Limnocylindrales bacterium]|nr:alpha/beta fold hydrolase [Candidatus Limnocylindrales bacterium]